MAFASKFPGMLYFASCVAVAASVLGSGCIATNTIEFESENFPPSVVSQENAEFPLDKIGEIEKKDDPLPPNEPAEMPLEVIIRDPNFEQTLEYRIFLDGPPPPPQPERPIQEGFIDPIGILERPWTFAIPHEVLTPGECHKIDLIVTGEFLSDTVEQRPPAEPGDFDLATWWVKVTDTQFPIAGPCR
jgi:hypothetical protein